MKYAKAVAVQCAVGIALSFWPALAQDKNSPVQENERKYAVRVREADPAIVILYLYPDQLGIGFVVKKNTVLTMAHIIYDRTNKKTIPRKPHNVINVMFPPEMRSVEAKILRTDFSKDLVLLSANTGGIKPLGLATKSQINEAISWYDLNAKQSLEPDYKDNCCFQVRGKVLEKKRYFKLYTYSVRDYELPASKELVLFASPATPRGTSGTPALNDNGEVVAVVMSRGLKKNQTQLISVEGIRKFLADFYLNGPTKNKD